MKFNRMASALAALAVLAAPVGAQAGTRAGSAATYQSASYGANRASIAVDDENKLAQILWILVVVAGGVTTYVATEILDTKSPT